MRRVTAGLAVAWAGVMSACGGGSPSPPTPAAIVAPAAAPTALVALADGGFLYAERLTGIVRRVGTTNPAPVPIAAVAADTAGEQRGLVGLAELDGTIYAAWTRQGDQRLVVGQVSPGPERLVWVGPVSTDRATGGHLVAWGGRLVVGVGDLLDPDAVADPTTPNGKLLAVDPLGPPDQTPRVLSSGWNNPFAFTVDDQQRIWVADNSPGREPERFGRGDVQTEPVDLPGHRAPAALVWLGDGRVGICGFLDGELRTYELADGRLSDESVVASGCRTGAAVRSGDVLLADLDAVRSMRLQP